MRRKFVILGSENPEMLNQFFAEIVKKLDTLKAMESTDTLKKI